MQPDMRKPTACMRRKPSKTYKSPTAAEWTTYAPCPSLRPKASSQTPTPPPTRSDSTQWTVAKSIDRSRHFTVQLLPLYHPQGELACSLPPLDPLSFGLDAPINEPESNITRSSSRHVRQKSPLAATDAGVQAPAASISATTVSAVAAVAAREIREKEKPSPSKRRTGGGGKRKRKDKDSDATYPAKRTRAPRNTTAPPVIEEESPNEMETNGHEDQDENNEADGEAATLEPRTTRSRAGLSATGLKRQSSVNTTTSDTPLKGPSPAPPDGPVAPPDVEMKPPPIEPPATVIANTKAQEEKEEGELSDDGQ